MSNVVSIDPEDRFVGGWKCCDGFSDVIFQVSIQDGAFAVSVDDPDSDSTPEVFGVLYRSASRTLEFSVHWNDTGRFVKATLIKYRRRHQPCLFAGHRAVGEGRLAVCRDGGPAACGQTGLAPTD